MIEYAVKVAVTSVLVVAIAEISKRSSFFGALVASLPLTSLLAMMWLYAETADADRVATLSHGIFWLVLPSLVLFLLLPLLLRNGLGFWPSLALSTLATSGAYAAMITILARLGIDI